MKEQIGKDKPKVHQKTGEPDKLIEVTALAKSFEDVQAVNQISFTVDRGKIFGCSG